MESDCAVMMMQLFSKKSGPVDARQRVLNESAPFVIKNDTDIKMQITFGEFYQVHHLLPASH